MRQGISILTPQQLVRIKYLNHALSSSSSNSTNHEQREVKVFTPQQLGSSALSMKQSICNIQLLPKAADLKKKAFDEFRLNMSAIVLLRLLSRNAMKSCLTSTLVTRALPNGQRASYRVVSEKARRLSGYEIGDDRKKRQRTIRKVMVGVAKAKSRNSSNRKSSQKNYAK